MEELQNFPEGEIRTVQTKYLELCQSTYDVDVYETDQNEVGKVISEQCKRILSVIIEKTKQQKGHIDQKISDAYTRIEKEFEVLIQQSKSNCEDYEQKVSEKSEQLDAANNTIQKLQEELENTVTKFKSDTEILTKTVERKESEISKLRRAVEEKDNKLEEQSSSLLKLQLEKKTCEDQIRVLRQLNNETRDNDYSVAILQLLECIRNISNDTKKKMETMQLEMRKEIEGRIDSRIEEINEEYTDICAQLNTKYNNMVSEVKAAYLTKYDEYTMKCREEKKTFTKIFEQNLEELEQRHSNERLEWGKSTMDLHVLPTSKSISKSAYEFKSNTQINITIETHKDVDEKVTNAVKALVTTVDILEHQEGIKEHEISEPKLETLRQSLAHWTVRLSAAVWASVSNVVQGFSPNTTYPKLQDQPDTEASDLD